MWCLSVRAGCLVALWGLSVGLPGRAVAAEPPPDAARSSSAALDLHELSRVDVRGTAAVMDQLRSEVEAMPAAARDRAVASLQVLAVSCPYTRSALQLPMALHAAVARVPAESLDPLIQQDWLYLQRGLADHVALLASLGVDLALPEPQDPLGGTAVGVMVDRVDLESALDPVAAAAPLIESVTPLARDVDGPTWQQIEDHSAAVEAATGITRPCPRGPWTVAPGHPWTLGLQLAGWHDALRRVAPFVDDPEVHAQVTAMVDLLDLYGRSSFVGRFSLLP